MCEWVVCGYVGSACGLPIGCRFFKKNQRSFVLGAWVAIKRSFSVCHTRAMLRFIKVPCTIYIFLFLFLDIFPYLFACILKIIIGCDTQRRHVGFLLKTPTIYLNYKSYCSPYLMVWFIIYLPPIDNHQGIFFLILRLRQFSLGMY